MEKRILLFCLLIITTLSSFALTAVADDIKLYVDGVLIACDVPPIIQNDRTLVPARALFEALDAAVTWNDAKRQVSARTESTKVILTIDSNVAYVNSVVNVLDTPPIILNDRTLVPARFVSEALNFDVRWFESTRSVYITPSKGSASGQIPDENEDENVKNSTIKSMVYSATDNNFVLKFTFSSPLGGYSLYNLDNPTRTVLELKGASYSSSKTIAVGSGGISQIRTANHEDYYKIVADLEKVLEKSFVLSSDKLSATLSFKTSDKINADNIVSELPSTNDSVEPDEELPEIIYDKYWEVADDSVIVLDAGHGGTDVGAIGYNELGEKVIYEKDVNLTVTLEVARILKEAGKNVILTRSEDKTLALSQRYRFSNTNNALLFVSIHHNSHETSSPYGALTLYSAAKDVKYPNLKSSKDIAKTIQRNLTEVTGLYDGGVRSEDELAVLRGTETSAVLVEVAFVSNYDDQKFLLNVENLMKAAAGIAAGILEVLED